MNYTAEMAALKEFCHAMEGREKDAEVLLELVKTCKKAGYATSAYKFEKNAGNQAAAAQAEAELKAIGQKLNMIYGKMIELGLDQLKDYNVSMRMR